MVHTHQVQDGIARPPPTLITCLLQSTHRQFGCHTPQQADSCAGTTGNPQTQPDFAAAQPKLMQSYPKPTECWHSPSRSTQCSARRGSSEARRRRKSCCCSLLICRKKRDAPPVWFLAPSRTHCGQSETVQRRLLARQRRRWQQTNHAPCGYVKKRRQL